MHKLIALYGSTEPLPDEIQLRAGDIDVVYQAGFLRYLSVNGEEVVRMINFLIRDENWRTIPMRVTEEEVEQGDASFSVSYVGLSSHGNIEFRWKCRIVGREDSTIKVSFEGEALSTFRRNRLGFTVLHPVVSCSGKSCTIEHPDASSEVRRFPTHISPDQPFLNIAAMAWQPMTGCEVKVIFDGEIFETEDQRNWSDASFKTYCTPLVKPIPVTIEKGTVIRQQIELRVTQDNPTVAPTEGLSFSLDTTTTTPFPKVGLCLSHLPHDEATWSKIADLSPDFLRIVVRSTNRALSPVIHDLLNHAFAIELVVYLDGGLNDELLSLLESFRDRILYLTILPHYGNSTSQALVHSAVGQLRSHFPNATIGGGTDAFFTELNRERTPTAEIDYLTFSANPQVHASDIKTMTENLAAMGDVVRSCQDFAGGKAVHVSPVTLRIRAKGGNATGGMPDDVDPRQLSLFAAGWTIGSFKYLAEAGAEAVTYFETCGWRGVLPHVSQPWPEEYRVRMTGVYPVYLALRSLLALKARRVARLMSSHPLHFDGVAFINDGEHVSILLASYVDRMLQVELPRGFQPKFYRTIGAHNIERLMQDGQLGELRNFSADRVVNLAPFSMMLLE